MGLPQAARWKAASDREIVSPEKPNGYEFSLNQPDKDLLDDEGKRRYQWIAGATMYLAQASRYVM